MGSDRGVPSWAWGTNTADAIAVYEAWLGFAATQGPDCPAVDSLVSMARIAGPLLSEQVLSVAIERGDWRTAGEMLGAAFDSMDANDRIAMVRRLWTSRACSNSVECHVLNELNETAPSAVWVVWKRVRAARDVCGSVAGFSDLESAVRSKAGVHWCQVSPGDE